MPKPDQHNLGQLAKGACLLVQSSRAVLEIKMVAWECSLKCASGSLEKGVSEIQGPSERAHVAQEDCVY